MKKGICAFALLVVIVFAVNFFGLIKSTSKHRVTEYNKGWTVIARGRKELFTDLDKYRFSDPVKKGELICIRNTLPDDMPDGSAIIFPLYLSSISVEVDGNVIYGYGSDRYSAGKMVGSGVHIIRIPDGTQGKNISIVIRAGENDAFSFLSGVMLDDTNWAFIDYLNINIYPVTISLSLIMAGITIMIISVFLAIRKLEWMRVNQTGVLFFVAGCWNVCETNAIQLFSLNYVWNTYACYFFGIFCILPLLRIVISAHKDKLEKVRIVQKVLFNLSRLLVFLTLILSIFNVIHICNAVHFFQIIAAVFFCLEAYLEWRHYSVKDVISSPRFREELVCFIFILLESLRYGLNERLNFRSSVLRHSILLYGIIVLVMMMIGSYIRELYESYLRQAEEKALKDIAYTDGLTGLLNRAFCKDRMEELDNSEKDYHMITFDVDGLKRINDSKGHLEGDKLLTSFADILTRCFSDVGDVIRPGGDEFLVISDDAGKQELMGRLQWLDSLEKNAGKALGFPVSAAYGLAGRSEVSGHSSEEVYLLADKRMYEMKAARK